MKSIKKIIEEMKEEKEKAFEVCDWGVANTLEHFIKKLEEATE